MGQDYPWDGDRRAGGCLAGSDLVDGHGPANVAAKMAMKLPADDDFELQVLASGVNVFFKPTKSHYTFIRLSSDKRIARSAPLSRDGSVRHDGPSGDTGDYDPAQVFEMAYELASMAAKRRGQ